MHEEKQPHKWAVAWTTFCDILSGTGGSFMMPEFGIRVIPAPNTLVAWIPRELHGTTLQDIDPADSLVDQLQMGAAIVTPPRLVGVWKAYAAQLRTLEEALEECAETDGEDA